MCTAPSFAAVAQGDPGADHARRQSPQERVVRLGPVLAAAWRRWAGHRAVIYSTLQELRSAAGWPGPGSPRLTRRPFPCAACTSSGEISAASPASSAVHGAWPPQRRGSYASNWRRSWAEASLRRLSARIPAVGTEPRRWLAFAGRWPLGGKLVNCAAALILARASSHGSRSGGGAAFAGALPCGGLSRLLPGGLRLANLGRRLLSEQCRRRGCGGAAAGIVTDAAMPRSG